MQQKILVIDDDVELLALTESRLKAKGYRVKTLNKPVLAMSELAAFKPDVVLLDLVMPEVPGEVLVGRIRRADSQVKIIVNSSKEYKTDYERCLAAGANAYLTKPLDYDKLAQVIKKTLADEMTVTFWGTRGSIPKPGKDTVKFGGNTSCVSVELTRDRWFVFDAGTGITELGRAMIAAKKRYKINLLISHPHWDHIQGLPFFVPVYQQGNEVTIYGTSQGRLSLQEVLDGQMNTMYFPVTMREFAAAVDFKELSEGDHQIENLAVAAFQLNHPGRTLGYRLTNSNGKTVAYITDNELVPDKDQHNKERLAKFLTGVDILIHDANYFDEEYPAKKGWGHSAVSEVLKLAEAAKVKRLYLFHHDPNHDDKTVARKEALGKRYFEERNLDIECLAARERHSVSI